MTPPPEQTARPEATVLTAELATAAPSHEAARERTHYNLTFAILALGGVALAMLQSLVAPALHEIQVDLGTSTTAVTWVLTAFLLSASVATPILGRLGDMFG